MEIQVQLEDVSAVKKKLRVQIPAEVATREFDRIAEQFRSRARLPGFRPGRAPAGLVKRHFIKDIREEVIRQLLPQSYQQALQEKSVEPLREPELGPVDFKEGEPFAYEAAFEIRPVVQLGSYKGIEVSAEAGTIGDKEIDEELEKLRERHSRLEAVEDRPVETGDYALVDLKGEYLVESGQEPPPPIQEEDITVRVGDENTHAAFSEALEGMQIGEEKQFEVEYPEDYPEKKMAGRRLSFTIEVTDIKRKALPQLNDEFARDVGDFKSLEELKDDIRKKLHENSARRRDADLRNKLVESLVASTSFEVPDVLMEEEIDRRLSELANNLVAQGADPFRANVDWKKLRQELRPSAEKSVRANLILSEIIRQEKIETTAEEMELEIQKIAESMGQPVEKVRQHLQQEERRAGLAANLRRRKALDLLAEHARVV